MLFEFSKPKTACVVEKVIRFATSTAIGYRCRIYSVSRKIRVNFGRIPSQ